MSAEERAIGAQAASLEGVATESAPARDSIWKGMLPGLMLVLVTATAADAVSSRFGLPVMVVALALGTCLAGAARSDTMVPGVEFAAKRVLRFGVALLGARITFGEILALGWEPILLVVVAILSTIAFGILAARVLGFSREFGLLSGGATGICGASAALAIGAALPHRHRSEQDVTFAVIGVTALSTVAMVGYPILCRLAGFDAATAGVFLGASIHDVAQVVGAGYSLSSETGDVATFTKLLRVCLLAPVVLLISVSYGVRGEGGKLPIPPFLLGFVALALVASAGIVPQPALDVVQKVSGFCLVGAVAALGLRTTVRALGRMGGRAMVLVVAETLFIAALTFVWLLYSRT